MTAHNSAGEVLSPTHLAHIVIKTPRYESMVAFYKTVLGARSTFENANAAFLTYDHEHHRIALINQPDLDKNISSRDRPGLHHVAFTFNSLRELTTAYSQRKALGILPVWCTNHGPTTSMYYEDPDGNRIETQVDNFDTSQEAIDYMTSGEFLKNGVGASFDPEDLIKKLDSGVPESELKKPVVALHREMDDIPIL
ncbi:Glyoxalase/Bleomycin resistance protein/Dihydroxybiphenyl dioxygenase [Xylariaceae sp. FL1651]|nr:Glyoxalase/Bleomycin resistance protein/Dihydroxybiphenyl dioxygenase [Xylariaceae sp. FL1651]